MKKNLYSLTLSDDVVREVDALAHRMGTNRSALVNQILAEYVSVPTPERRWNDIFEAIEELMTPTRELVPFFAPGSSTMSLKSSLSYKYRPTVKYEVDLSNGDGQTMGSLNIVFRTQSAALISAMTSFFRLWVQIEDKCLAPLLGSSISCALYDGRFVRPLAMPRGKALTADDVAGGSGRVPEGVAVLHVPGPQQRGHQVRDQRVPPEAAAGRRGGGGCLSGAVRRHLRDVRTHLRRGTERQLRHSVFPSTRMKSRFC